MVSGPGKNYKSNIVEPIEERSMIIPDNEMFEKDNDDYMYDTELMTLRATKLDQLIDAFQKKHNISPMIDKLEKLEQLAIIMKQQLNISTNILQASR